MKICGKEKIKVQRLRYEDLNTGDVFTWVDESVASLKENDGYVYLEEGLHYKEALGCAGDEVIRYPNACITLGDPE